MENTTLLNQLNYLYQKHKAQLSETQIYQIDLAILIEDVPNYVMSYFDKFKEQKKHKSFVGTNTNTNNSIDNVIVDFDERIKRLLKERSYTHNQMRHSQTDEERYEYANRLIVEIQADLEILYQQKDNYIKNGIIPISTTTENIKRQTKEKIAKEASLRATLSKLKKNDGRKSDIERIEIELAEIRQWLKT